MNLELNISFLFAVSIFGYFTVVLLSYFLCKSICPSRFEAAEMADLGFEVYEVTFLDCSCVKTCCPCPALSLRQLRRRLCPTPKWSLKQLATCECIRPTIQGSPSYRAFAVDFVCCTI